MPEELQQIVDGADDLPLGAYAAQVAQRKAPEAAQVFDVTDTDSTMA
jgi:hypothetical protein